MDSMSFDTSLPDKPLNAQCLVCGSQSLANYVDLSLSSSRTSQSNTPIKSKLSHILVDSWASSDNEVILCSPCFHLVDQFDVLEIQLDAIRKDLTDKYVSRIGFRSQGKERRSTSVILKKVLTEPKKKRRPYTKRKKPSYDDPNSYVPPDNVMQQIQEMEHSFDANNDVPQVHSVNAGMVWSTDSVQLQQLGDITVTNSVGWKKRDEVQQASMQQSQTLECSVDNGPAIVYDNDPNFLNPGERLRIGLEHNGNGVASYACVYCDRVAPSVDGLKCHVHAEHFPKVLMASIPPELGLGNTMNCGVQLANVGNAPPDTAKPFACVFCDAAFKCKSNLNLHFKEKHTPHKPFSCVDCLESFRRSMELSRHKVYYCPHRKKNLPRKDKKSNSYNS